MNNIEKLQNIFKELRKDDEEGHSSAYELQWEDISTIENLIIENKKLIQENKELNDKILKMAMYGGSIKAKNYIEKNYIRKSKIEKMINELFEEMDELDKEEFDEDIVNEKRNLQDTIIVLKKLLQEGDVNNE